MRAPSITRVVNLACGLAAPAVIAFGALTATATLAADPAASDSTSATAPAVASDVAGVVKTVKGTVRIERSGGSSAAVVGSDVYSRDRVMTGPESSVGIT